MDEDTHQKYLKACKRAHMLEESIKTPLSPFLLHKEHTCHLKEEETDDKSSSADT